MTHKIIFITLASLTHFFSYFGPDEFSKIISSITYNISPFNKTTKIPCVWQVVPNTFPCKQLSLCINIFPLLFALFQTHAYLILTRSSLLPFKHHCLCTYPAAFGWISVLYSDCKILGQKSQVLFTLVYLALVTLPVWELSSVNICGIESQTWSLFLFFPTVPPPSKGVALRSLTILPMQTVNGRPA